MAEQYSLFDIELPPYNEPVPEEPQAPEEPQIPQKQSPIINFAKVPDEEFSAVQWAKIDVPKVDSILKLLDKGTYRVNRHEFLSDVFECGAIAISNRFDFCNAEKREQKYLELINKYDKAMQNLLADVFANIYSLLTNMINPFVEFKDYLGELYMRSETSSNKAGQFFTPFCVSKACAKMAINADMVEKRIAEDEILTMHEPTVGSGGMILAAADVLYNDYRFNIARNLFVECGDIDKRCVHMTYLQLGLAGIPAVIFHRNGITLETWDRWETPAYIMQYTRFKNVLKGTANDWRKD